MPPTYLLPVITTKEQIGLSNLTNDLQLKKESDLSDLNDITSARDNLGLGNSATKNVGTGAENIASGNHDHDSDYAGISHNHSGVYEPVDASILRDIDVDDTPVNEATAVPVSSNWAYDHAADNVSALATKLAIIDIDDTPVDAETIAPISSNWAYDKVVSDALELARLKGISLTQADLLYMYNHNTKLIANCENVEAWEDLSWSGGGVATHGDDETNFKVGSQGISVTASANSTIRLVQANDLSIFEDGATSADTDYIEYSIYTQDVGTVQSCIMYLPCDAGTLTNYYSYVFTSLLANGWNHIKVQKSAFGTTASPDWADVKGTILQINTSGGSVTYTIDAIRMTRKDVSDANPNPLQLENDGEIERVFEITLGTQFLGYDGSNLVLKGLETSAILSVLTFEDIYFKCLGISSEERLVAIQQYYNDAEFNGVYVRDDQLRIYQRINNNGSYIGTVDFPIDSNDEIDFSGSILGTSLFGYAGKTGNKATIHRNSAGNQTGNKLRVYIYEDASMISFVASSSPLLVNN